MKITFCEYTLKNKDDIMKKKFSTVSTLYEGIHLENLPFGKIVYFQILYRTVEKNP